MPHILLETTADLVENTDIADILDSVVSAVSRDESVDPVQVSSCHALRSVWHMGSGAPAGFVRCDVSFVAAVSDAIRSRIADAVFAELTRAFGQSIAGGEVMLAVKVFASAESASRELPHA